MTGTEVAVSTDEIRRRFVDDPESVSEPSRALERIIADVHPLLDRTSSQDLLERTLASLIGLGPLERLLTDESVTDVLVNGAGVVWVDRAGRLERSAVTVDGPTLALVVERAFHRSGRSVDRAHPIGETRLRDGTRLSVVLPPVAVDGPIVAIRRFATRAFGLDAFGPPEVERLLRRLVSERANVVVFGATGSGKTSLVNALASAVDPGERIVTIEDAAELRVDHPHVVRLECRYDNGDGVGRVDLRALVRAALRLRPDRLVVGEVRGPEALDMVWAMATGHRGSLSTCHASTALDALARLETFILLADAALPLPAVRAQVRAAVGVLVGVERVGADRRVTSVHRVVTDVSHPTGIERVGGGGR